jgi:hypothetical protein
VLNLLLDYDKADFLLPCLANCCIALGHSAEGRPARDALPYAQIVESLNNIGHLTVGNSAVSPKQ